MARFTVKNDRGSYHFTTERYRRWTKKPYRAERGVYFYEARVVGLSRAKHAEVCSACGDHIPFWDLHGRHSGSGDRYCVRCVTVREPTNVYSNVDLGFAYQGSLKGKKIRRKSS